MNGKQVIKLLKAEGWTLKDINGSHHQMIKNGVKVSVPVHGAADLPKKTLAAISKQSGVKLK